MIPAQSASFSCLHLLFFFLQTSAILQEGKSSENELFGGVLEAEAWKHCLHSYNVSEIQNWRNAYVGYAKFETMEMQKQWDKFKYFQNMKILLFSLLLACAFALANPQSLRQHVGVPSLGLPSLSSLSSKAVSNTSNLSIDPVVKRMAGGNAAVIDNPFYSGSNLPPLPPADNPNAHKAPTVIMPHVIPNPTNQTNNKTTNQTTNQTTNSSKNVIPVVEKEKKDAEESHHQVASKIKSVQHSEVSQKETHETSSTRLDKAFEHILDLKNNPNNGMGFLGNTADSAPHSPIVQIPTLILGGAKYQPGMTLPGTTPIKPTPTVQLIKPITEHYGVAINNTKDTKGTNNTNDTKDTSGIASQSQASAAPKKEGAYECLDSHSAHLAMNPKLRAFSNEKLLDQRVQNYLLLLVCQKGVSSKQILTLLYATDEGHLEMTVEKIDSAYKMRSKAIYFTGMQLPANIVPAYAAA